MAVKLRLTGLDRDSWTAAEWLATRPNSLERFFLNAPLVASRNERVGNYALLLRCWAPNLPVVNVFGYWPRGSGSPERSL